MKLSNILKVSGVYVGTVVGAGFASGRELVLFFLSFGDAWFLGVVFSALLFSVLGYGVLVTAKRSGASGYGSFLRGIMGRRLGRLMEIVSGLFLCVLFYAMTAATGAAFKEAFGISYITGVVLMLVLCFFVFLFETRGIVAVNALLSPLLILCGFGIGLYILFSGGASAYSLPLHNLPGIAFSSVVYVSYNIITASAVLVSVKDTVKTEGEALASSIVSGLALAFLGLFIGIAVYSNKSCMGMEIPMLGVALKYGPAIRTAYMVMLISAIFTTAAGDGFAVLSFLAQRLGFGRNILALVFLSTAFFVSLRGFSGIIDTFYTAFGYMGIIQSAAVALALLKDNY